MSSTNDVAGMAFSAGDIGELIRAERKARGLTQQELADKVGCSRMTISDLESGQNTNINTIFGVLGGLGKGLRVVSAQVDVDRLHELFGEDDEQEGEEATRRDAPG